MTRLLPLLALMLMASVFPIDANAEGTAASYVESMLPRAQRVGIVDSVDVSSTSVEGARTALDPSFVSGSDKAPGPGEAAASPVDLILMHGHFTDTLARMPHGVAPPTGTVMAFVINRETGQVIETYVGNLSPSVGTSILKETVAPAARARASRARAANRRRAKVATWGTKCTAGELNHCYALATWEMHGGEQVEGTESLQWTAKMNVPYYYNGDFVSNEEWVSFFNSPTGTPYWVEMGNTSTYRSCCAIYAFWADQNHYGYHEKELWEKYLNEWSAYTMNSVGSGTWCVYVGANKELPEGCVGGFEVESKELQTGTEMADEAQPENRAWVETAALWQGTGHQWLKAVNGLYNTSGKVSYNGMCVAPYAPWNYPGNIYSGSYGTC
jgi:hypothetical protein